MPLFNELRRRHVVRVGMTYAVVAGWWNLSATATTYDSIAVLPFVNLSSDSGNEDNEYLGDGLAEELLNALGNVSALKVAARTSAFSFKGRDVDIRSIGEQLGVVSVRYRESQVQFTQLGYLWD